jgi:hypothetical protein
MLPVFLPLPVLIVQPGVEAEMASRDDPFSEEQTSVESVWQHLNVLFEEVGWACFGRGTGPEVDPSANATALAVYAQSVTTSQSPFPSVFWGHPSVFLLTAAPG